MCLQEYCAASLVTLNDNDFRDEACIRGLFEEFKPKYLVNCYEYPDLDAAEYEREQAYAINGHGAGILSGICRDSDTVLVHISTSYIFKGRQREHPYREDDDSEPVSVYGDSKLLGERLILGSGCRHIIVRVPDLFGGDLPLFGKRLASIHDDSSLWIVRGQVVSMAFIEDLARVMSELVSRGCEGIYHFSQNGFATTAGFFSKTLELLSRYGATDKKYSITEVDTEDFVAPGDRPVYNVLDNAHLEKSIGCSLRTWERALEDYIEKTGCSIILTEKEW